MNLRLIFLEHLPFSSAPEFILIKTNKNIFIRLTNRDVYDKIYICNVYWHYCLKELMGCTIIQKLLRKR